MSPTTRRSYFPVGSERVFFVVSGDEVFPRGCIRDLIARASDIATALTKDGEDSALVFCFRGA